MSIRIIALAAGLALPIFVSIPIAHAEEYCREYTRTITVGGVRQQGYGTACYRPDGSWEIVNLQGQRQAQDAVRETIRDDLYRDDRRVVVVDRVRPAAYYPSYYYASPSYRTVYYQPWPPGHTKNKKHCPHGRHGRGYGHGHHYDDD